MPHASCLMPSSLMPENTSLSYKIQSFGSPASDEPVGFAQVQELYLAVVPQENAVCQNELQGHGKVVPDCHAQTLSVLKQIENVLQQERYRNSVISQTVFLSDLANKQLVRKMMADFYGSHQPSTTYVQQPPCGGSEIAVELFGVRPLDTADNHAAQSLFARHFNDKATLYHQDGVQFLFLADVLPDETPLGSYRRSLNAFTKMEAFLANYGFVPEQILRTWLYQGLLVFPEGQTQRYKELNRARTDFFSGRKFLDTTLPKDFYKRFQIPENRTIYPASTGIGADDFDIVMSAVAFSTTRNDVMTVPLENPNQTSAFDYNAVYSPQSPKFSRAMSVRIADTLKIYVSGTAGITESESRFENDVVAQTDLTLDNIAALISSENLKSHGVQSDANGFSPDLAQLASARVYVKRESDYETVRSLCEKRCPGVPMIYTIADVCRQELLVEIEGVVSLNSCANNIR